MSHPRISLIAALAASDRAIGFQNQLLWHIPEDFRSFKNTTSGHAIILGEQTYRSIGWPLPGRTNIVLSKDPAFAPEGCVMVHSLEEALEKARAVERDEIFVCGS